MTTKNQLGDDDRHAREELDVETRHAVASRELRAHNNAAEGELNRELRGSTLRNNETLRAPCKGEQFAESSQGASTNVKGLKRDRRRDHPGRAGNCARPRQTSRPARRGDGERWQPGGASTMGGARSRAQRTTARRNATSRERRVEEGASREEARWRREPRLKLGHGLEEF